MAQFDFQGDFPYAAKVGNSANTDITPWDNAVDLVQAADRVQLVRRPRRKGNFSMRIECRQNDNSTQTNRTEIFVNNAGRNLYTEGDKFWFASSIFVPQDFPVLNSWFLFHQMHGAESGSPPWAMEMTNEQLIFTARGGDIAVGGDTNWARNNSYIIHPSLPRGVWLDFLVYTELSVSSAGVNKVWYRQAGSAFPSTPQVDVTGPNLISIAGVTLALPPPRISIYRNARTDTTVLYHGGIRIKQTRAAAEAFFTDPVSLSAEILADSPIGYWPLSETTGTFADLGSGNHPGTAFGEPIRGMPSLTRNGQGKGVNFAPSNSYISIGDLSLGEGNECTMECMVKVNAGSGNYALLSEGRGSSSIPVNEMGIFFGSARHSYINDASTTTNTSFSGSGARNVFTGKVHHVLSRWSKTLNRVEVFVDGEQQGTSAWAPGTLTLDNFAIGTHLTNSGPSRSVGDVTVQHVAVYDTYLSDERVQARWAAAMRDSWIDGSGPVNLTPYAATTKAMANVSTPALGTVVL
jgi:hypothetical protein